jgi:hypothetical protein
LEFGEHATKIANLPEKMRRYGLLSNKFSGKEKAKQALLSVLPMLKSERRSISENLDHDRHIGDKLDKLQERIDQLNIKLGLVKYKPYPKEDPGKGEVKALYEEIRKTLS